MNEKDNFIFEKLISAIVIIIVLWVGLSIVIPNIGPLTIINKISAVIPSSVDSNLPKNEESSIPVNKPEDNDIAYEDPQNTLIKNLADIEKVIESEPNNATAWIDKGVYLSQLERFDDSYVAYEHAINLDPTNPAPWIDEALDLEHQKRNEEGLIKINHAIQLHSDNTWLVANAWITKSKILYNLKRYEESLKAADKAIELDPENYSYAGWTNKQLAYEALGRDKEAQEAASKRFQYSCVPYMSPYLVDFFKWIEWSPHLSHLFQ